MSREGSPEGGDVELTSVATLNSENGLHQEGDPVFEPDGLHDEHKPLRNTQDSSADYKASYTSLDPSRCVSVSVCRRQKKLTEQRYTPGCDVTHLLGDTEKANKEHHCLKHPAVLRVDGRGQEGS